MKWLAFLLSVISVFLLLVIDNIKYDNRQLQEELKDVQECYRQYIESCDQNAKALVEMIATQREQILKLESRDK